LCVILFSDWRIITSIFISIRYCVDRWRRYGYHHADVTRNDKWL